MRWLVFFALFVPSLAMGEERYATHYNGSFWEVSARAGLNDDSTQVFDFGLRQSFPMHLGDTRLSFRHDRFEPDAFNQAHVGFGLHPLYVVLLGSDWISYVVASFYIEVGGGVGFADGPHPLWTLGTGLDVPLFDPDAGMAPWLNVLYRYEWTTATMGGQDLDRHTGFLGLAWRVNGLLW